MMNSYKSLLVQLVLLSCLTLSMQQQCTKAKTQTDLLGPFYVANSLKTNRMAPIDQLRNPSKRLEVAGRIYSVRDCSSNKYRPISNLKVEVWYAGKPDNNGNYYQNKQYRGQLVASACGYYSFVQAFPELYPDRPIIHTHFRISDSKNKELLVTQMYFIGTEKGYYNQDTINDVLRGRRDAQAVVVRKRKDGTRRVRFDIFLDTSGNKTCARI